ncbi:AAA family ATPase [Corynebacterium macginleyi]|uniref:AAA family ATPase n=1 Tax=Corynebacterium macginleyi TaxID=38290 RepID=UPI00190B2B6E|nr:AAA family ATPase [Corynebacterium macginleyi]MBK4143120.1 AAA family ATPase [Corynebacterium macginleyi]
MRIHSLEIKNVRGIEHLVLDDLPETGVVVIHGENEAGKSTIVEALDVVLTEKHTAGSSGIRELQPVGKDVSPEVNADISVGEYRFRIAKRWLKKRYSELVISSPRHAQYTGRQADDELEQILSRNMDRQLLDVLFMRQDDSKDAISAAGIPSLTRALEQETGLADDEVSGDDSQLLAKVDREYKRYFTGKAAKATGEYKKAQETLERATRELEEATAAVRGLDSVVERYEHLERQQEVAEEQLPAARQDLAEKQSAADEAVKAQHQVDAHKAELVRAKEDFQRAKDAQSKRQEMTEALEAAGTAKETAAENLAAAREKAAEENQKKEAAEKKLATAKEDYATARAALKQARLYQDKEIFQRLDKRLLKVEDLALCVENAQAEIAQRGRAITAADVEELRKADADLSLAKRLHDATAAKVEFSGPEGAEIGVDGKQVDIAKQPAIELVDGREITIGNITARFVAGAYSSDKTQREVDQAEARLQELFATTGVESIAAAEALHKVHSEQNAGLDAAARKLEGELGPDDLGELRAQHAALKKKVSGLDDAPTMNLSAAEDAEEKARELVDALDRELIPFRESRIAHDVVRLEAELDAATEKSERAQRELAEAREKTSDAGLEEETKRLDMRVTTLEEQLSEMEAVDLATAQNLVAGAQSHLEYLQNQVHDSKVELGKLSSEINYHSGAAEREQQAQAAAEMAQAVLESVEKRALAARYLRELLLKHRDAARQRYAEPFVAALAQLAHTIYGGDISFELAEDLSVTARTRDDETVAMTSLSGGAREQLAILTRFAIARLVAGEESVPVIVDDALGSTDAHRLQLMSTLFSQVGRENQVLVFTCMPQRYSRVIGRSERDIAMLKGVI